MPGRERTSGKAIASLVLGLVSLLVLPVVCAPLAIAFGALALIEVKNVPALKGRALAVAGMLAGAVGLTLGIVAGFALLLSG